MSFPSNPSRGFEVAICSTPGPELDQIIAEESPMVFPLVIAREPRPFRDLISLILILNLLVRFRPDIVNAGTPKAGFLFMVAAWLVRVPRRVYHLRGLRHESLTGFTKWLQVRIEKITGLFATHVVCETESVRDLSLEEGLYAEEKCHVLGPGSSGIEIDKFNPADFPKGSRAQLRQTFEIPEAAPVIGFVGRLVPRKGVEELMEAWSTLREIYPSAYLLLVGPFEAAQPITVEAEERMKSDPRVLMTGKVDNVAAHLAVMDIFTLPAHWEGFGNVVVEAAAMGLPVVTTNGSGTRDAAKNDYNALMIEPKDSEALTHALARYMDDPDLRRRHGANGMVWAERFDRKNILAFLYEFYRKILS